MADAGVRDPSVHRQILRLVLLTWMAVAGPAMAWAQDAPGTAEQQTEAHEPDDAARSRLAYLQGLPTDLAVLVMQAEVRAEAGDMDGAEALLDQADALATGALIDTDPQWAILWLARGRLQTDQGRYADALALLSNAMVRARSDDGPLMAALLYDTARVQDALGRHSETEALARRALELRQQLYGSVAEPTADASNLLGNALMAQGRYVEAEFAFRQVIGIFEVLKGPDDVDLAGPLTNLANSLRRSGRGIYADRLYQRALHIAEASGNRSRLAQGRTHYGWYLHIRGRGAEAEPLFNRALALALDLVGPDHPFTGIARANLGYSLSDQALWSEAEGPFRQGLSVLEAGIGPESPDLTLTLLGLARVLLELGQVEESEALYVRAHDLAGRTLGPTHADALQSAEGRVGFLLRTQRPEEGLAHVRQSLDGLLGEDRRDRNWRSRTRLVRPLFGRHVEAAWLVSHSGTAD